MRSALSLVVSLCVVATAGLAGAQEAEDNPVLWEEAPGPSTDVHVEANPSTQSATAEATTAAPPVPGPQPACPALAQGRFERTVAIRLRGTVPGVRYELVPVYRLGSSDDFEDSEGVAPAARCDQECRLVVPAGRYRLRATAPRELDVHPGAREIVLRRDADLVVTPPNATRRRNGLTTAILGTVLAPVGLITLMAGVSVENDEDLRCDYGATCENERVNGAVYAGAAMALAGAIMIPVGWVTFGRNRHPRVRELPPTRASSGEQARATPALAIGTRPVASGYGLGLDYVF